MSDRKTKPRSIAPDTLEKARPYLNHRPRIEAARLAGVSLSTLYRAVRVLGGEIRKDLSTRQQTELTDIVITHFPTMSIGEIAAKFGYEARAVQKRAKLLGVRHTPETAQRLRNKTTQNLRTASPNHKKGAEKWKRTRRMEEIRMWSGLQRRTKLRFAKMPLKAYKAKWSLLHRYGYTPDEKDPYTLLYAPGARRTPNEAYFTERRHIKFKPIIKEEDEQQIRDDNSD